MIVIKQNKNLIYENSFYDPNFEYTTRGILDLKFFYAVVIFSCTISGFVEDCVCNVGYLRDGTTSACVRVAECGVTEDGVYTSRPRVIVGKSMNSFCDDGCVILVQKLNPHISFCQVAFTAYVGAK